MHRLRERSRYDRRETINHMFGWPAAILVCAAVAFGANTIATASNNLDPEEHRGSLPGHVVLLAPDSYLIYDEADLTPSDICKGSSDSSDSISYARRIDSLDKAVFAKCGVDQSWNVPATNNPSMARAAMLTSLHPGWWIPTVSLLFLTLIYPVVIGGNELLGWRKDMREAKRKKRIEKKALAEKIPVLENKRRELVGAWARNEIDDLTFENKLDELVQQGLPEVRE